MQKILSKWTVFCYNLSMTIFGYARVGANGQTLDAQVLALKAAGAARVFRETASGAKSDRRELASALKSLGDGDTLLVTRLDRLARSTRDLLSILDAIAKAGAGFRSLADTWADTTMAHGHLMRTVVSGLAEFERNLLRARTGEGRERAKTRGQHMGRPPVLTSHQRRAAMSALAAGTATQADLARQFNVSQSTISRLVEKAISAPPKPGLDSETERVARSFMRHIAGRYPVCEAIVYGSRARHTHRPDSDADIAVVLQGGHGDRAAASLDMAGVAFDVMMETGVLVQALPLWEDEIARPETFSNPALINNILREGVRL
jgi:DNA invertase Pin-like site-specific DNA recombinase/predicted nucleotidyltransferase